MAHLPIDHSDQPIRLFKSDFLEFFTHITPAAVLAIWLPVAGFVLFRSLRAAGPGFPSYLPLGFLAGLALWTFAEYTLHRFVFHFRPRNAVQAKIVFLFHGIHHAQPQIKTRLVMPPVVSVPMAVIFYLLFITVVGRWLNAPLWVDPLFVGFIIGYLIYDMIHYATHHFPMRSGIWKALKRHHMKHHYKTPDELFGVSSPFWDVVFDTLPEEGGTRLGLEQNR